MQAGPTTRFQPTDMPVCTGIGWSRDVPDDVGLQPKQPVWHWRVLWCGVGLKGVGTLVIEHNLRTLGLSQCVFQYHCVSVER